MMLMKIMMMVELIVTVGLGVRRGRLWELSEEADFLLQLISLPHREKVKVLNSHSKNAEELLFRKVSLVGEWGGGRVETGVTHTGPECVCYYGLGLVSIKFTSLLLFYQSEYIFGEWGHFCLVLTTSKACLQVKILRLGVRVRGQRGSCDVCVLPPASSCPHQGEVCSALFESPAMFHKGRSMKSIKRSIER